MKTATDPLARLLALPPKQQSSEGFIHTGNEIMGQPDLLLATAELVSTQFAQLSEFLKDSNRILLSGSGTSHFISLSVQPFLTSKFKVVEAIQSTDILLSPESSFPREPFVLVSIARSGQSPEGNEVARLANRLRPGLVRHLALTCNDTGELANIVSGCGPAGLVLSMPEQANDKALAMTGAYSAMTLAGLGLGFLNDQSGFSQLSRQLAMTIKHFMPIMATVAARLAESAYQRVYFLSSRPQSGGSVEAQLKVEEMTAGAVIAKHYDPLGLRHGPLAGIDQNTIVFLNLSNDRHRRLYEMDLLSELDSKKLGAERIVIGTQIAPEPRRKITATFIDTGEPEGLADSHRAVLCALPGQLLGFFTSLRMGLKPDTPSPGGIISRVVQGVRIHHDESQGSGK